MQSNPNRPTPYNTGKVSIGSNYVPKHHYESDETDFWQSVLLGEYQQQELRKTQWVLYVAVLIAVFILLSVSL
jgi:hypothetical protein